MYQHLSLPFDFSEYVKFENSRATACYAFLDETQLAPDFLALLWNLGMVPTNVASFFTPPHAVQPVHIDYNGTISIAKLNFAYGAPDSKMIWYRYDGEYPPLDDTIKRLSHIRLDIKKCFRIGSTSIKNPTLVDAGLPHSVFNGTNSERWVLTMVLRDSSNRILSFDEAKERLREYWL